VGLNEPSGSRDCSMLLMNLVLSLLLLLLLFQFSLMSRK
jgi:hypothetical protein